MTRIAKAARAVGTDRAQRLVKTIRAVNAPPTSQAPHAGEALRNAHAPRTLAALWALSAVRTTGTLSALRIVRALRTGRRGEKPTPTTTRLAVTAIAAVLVLSATFAAGHWIAPSAPEATPDGGRSPVPSSSGPVEAGPAIICADGTISHTAPHQGACSWHGGGAGSTVSIEGDTVPWTRVDASVPDVLTAPRARSRDVAARRLITVYYRALSRGNYRAAFRRLSTGQQERLGPGRTWARKLTGTRYRHVDVLYLDDTLTGWTVTLSYDGTTRNGTCTSTVLQRAITTERGHLRLADPTVLAQSPCA